jgi:hypothetical protein
MAIANIGRGPAINALYLREERSNEESVFLRTGPLNIGQGQEIAVPAEQQDESHPNLFAGQTDFPKELVVCHDQFSNYLCFLPGSAGPWVWREERDERGLPILGEQEPAWVTAVQQILWEGRPQPEPDPDPGYAFVRAISITGNPTYCETTVALEAAPASDVKPTDAMSDVVERWMLSLEPQAKRTSLDLMWWLVERPGRMGPDFDGRLESGPLLSVRQVIQLQARPAPVQGGQPEADLPLLAVVTDWKRIVSEGLSVIAQLHARRVRLGLTLFTYGNWDQPRMLDVDFNGLPRPQRRVVSTGLIGNLLYRSPVFDVATFPDHAIEAATRQLLRIFGYREVDDVIAALELRTPG